MKVGKVVNLNQFKGINNVDDPSAVGANTLVEGTNVYISSKRRIRRRSGMANVITGSMHSAFATSDEKTMLSVKDNALVLVNKDLSVTQLRATMLPMPVAYVEINGVVYYSNGIQSGRVVGGTHGNWGITPPNTVSLQRINGIMQAGTYGAIAAYLRGDNQLSGTSFPTAIEVPSDSGIRVGLQASTDPEVIAIALYMTTPDGADYYRVGVVPNATQTYTHQGSITSIRPRTMNMGPPPPGQALAELSGRCLIATGDTLYHTHAYSYELVDYSRNYKQLADWIDVIAAVADGAFLSYGNHIAFMRGRDLDAAELTVMANYGSTAGTVAYVDHVAGIDLPSKRIPMWSTEHGVVAGFDGGQLVNLSEGSYRTGRYKSGGAVYLQRDGDQIYIAAHRGSPIPEGNTRNPTGIDVENRGPL